MEDHETLQYLFDLQGYVVLEDVLSSAEVGELNRLLDGQGLSRPGLKTEKARFGSGGAGPETAGLLEWGKPFCDLLDHPRVMPALRIILGDGFRIDHVYGIHMKSGTESLNLHGGAVPYDPTEFYHFNQGKMYNGLVVVSWNLVDTGPGIGGFLCVPGSHKSNYPIPDSIMNAHDGAECVVTPEVKTGSVVIFTEGLSHGTEEWQADYERRSLLYKYTPSYMAFTRKQIKVPGSVEITARQRSLFEPPSHSGSFGRPTLFEDATLAQ